MTPGDVDEAYGGEYTMTALYGSFTRTVCSALVPKNRRGYGIMRLRRYFAKQVIIPNV